MNKTHVTPYVAQYSLKEEIANSTIHGIGVLLSIVGPTVLIVLAALKGTSNHLVSYIIYGVSLILLYTASTLYHAITHLKAKQILKICDHAAIYLLIAGTYTPFLILNFKPPLQQTYLILMWALALSGVIFKIFYTGRFNKISTLLYVVMGHMILFAMNPMLETVPSTALQWLFLGGFSYTFGCVFYLMKKVPFHHAIWHVFVLTGSIFHFVAVYHASNLNFGTS